MHAMHAYTHPSVYPSVHAPVHPLILASLQASTHARTHHAPTCLLKCPLCSRCFSCSPPAHPPACSHAPSARVAFPARRLRTDLLAHTPPLLVLLLLHATGRARCR
eukprot:152449-Chlamydomonas_euryale.AAC.2